MSGKVSGRNRQCGHWVADHLSYCPECRTEQTIKTLTQERDQLRKALSALEYPDDPGRFCDHAAEPCERCVAARAALGKVRSQ